MEQWLTLTLLFSAIGIFFWSMRELTRWFLRINVLEEKIDHLHHTLNRIEERILEEELEINDHLKKQERIEEQPKRQSLFLLKERDETWLQ